MSESNDSFHRVKKIADHKTARAAGRIGFGTIVAMVFAHFVEIPTGLREGVAGLIILVFNELAYAAELIWKHFVKKLEEWS